MHEVASGRRPTGGARSWRCGCTSECRCLAPEHLPRESHVVLRRSEVADCEPELVPVGEARMREKDLAGVVYALEDPLVELVRALAPKTDEREVPRGGHFPAWLGAHPALEELGEPQVLAQALLQAREPVAAKHCPELERPEPPAERDRQLTEVEHVVRRAKVFGDEAECVAEVLRPPSPQNRAVDRHAEPFVRVEAD